MSALLDLSPGNVLGLSLQANVELLRGHAAAALELYSELKHLHPRLSVGRMGVAPALLSLDRSSEADSEVEALVRDWRDHYLSPYQLAMVASRRGDISEALDLLHRAMDE